jgi:hypothetical protein
MSKQVKTLLTVVLALCLQAAGLFGTAYAGNSDLSPADVKVSTPEYAPASSFTFPNGTYKYEVSWKGIPAGTATISLDNDGSTYRLVATAATMSWVELFYTLRYRAEGLVDSSSFKPQQMTIKKRENSKLSHIQVSFDETGEIYSKREKTGREAKELRFNPHNGTLDPFSASLLARSLDWKVGQSRQFDTYNGKTRYLITLNCLEAKVMDVNGLPRAVWIIEPTVTNLLKNKPAKKLRRAFMYVTADSKREVVKIESEVLVGSVTTKLESFTPFPTQPQYASVQ